MLITLSQWVEERDGMTGSEYIGLRDEAFACLFCGHGLEFPFVLWHGPDKDLTLHPKCAVELGTHLIGDGKRELLTRPGMGNITHHLVVDRLVKERMTRGS